MNIIEARAIVAGLVAPFNRDFFEFIEYYGKNTDKYSPIEQAAVLKFEQHVFNPAE
jgi:hypothetical protein